MQRGAFKQRLGRILVLGASGVALWLGAGTPAAGQRPKLLGLDSSLGAYPCAQLAFGVDGALYGTAYGGGDARSGVVFRLNADGTAYTMLHSFSENNGDGAYPGASLVQGWDVGLYGTTPTGGAAGYGPVFRLNADGSGYGLLHSFSGSGGDGAYPVAALVQGWDGALYGTTYSGGNAGAGTVFKLNLDGAEYSVLHSFAVEDGALPCASLIQGSDGVLYGTTYSGGSNNAGTIFRLNPDGTGYAPLHSFRGSGGDGAYPFSQLVQGWDGVLYGTTCAGGSNNVGTVFKLNPDGTGYTQLHSFARGGTDGACPYSALVQGWDWTLYGTTLFGGSNNAGTVYKLNADGTGYALLHTFARGDAGGAFPYSAVVQGQDWGLYGTTVLGGSNNAGTVYKLSVDGAEFTVLHSFFASSPEEETAEPEVTPPQLASLRRLSDGNVEFSLAGQSNRVWRVEAAASLVEPVNWETVAFLLNLNGVVPFIDLSATNYPRRYYRAVWP